MGARAAIQDKLYTVLAANATITSLCGGTARVYQSFDKEERAVDHGTNLAYLTVGPVATGHKRLDVSPFVRQISVFGNGRKRVDDILDVIDSLFEASALAATGWTDVAVSCDVAGPRWAEGAWQADVTVTIEAY